MQDNFEKLRNQMEMVSMLIVALEKIQWSNKTYQENLESMLFDTIADIKTTMDTKKPKGAGKGPKLLDLDQPLGDYEGDF